MGIRGGHHSRYNLSTQWSPYQCSAHLDPKICRTQSVSRAHIRIDSHLATNVYVTDSRPRIPLLAAIDMT